MTGNGNTDTADWKIWKLDQLCLNSLKVFQQLYCVYFKNALRVKR